MQNSFIAFLVLGIAWTFFFLQGCSSPPLAKTNYEECRELLEEARQDAKSRESYSYTHQEYEECRRPAYLRLPKPGEENQ